MESLYRIFSRGGRHQRTHDRVTITTIHDVETAIRAGQLEPIKTWLDKPGRSANIRRCEVLHLAAECGQVEIARLLIQYNFPVDCRNYNKQTPLHIACSKGHLNMVRMLVTEYKANLTVCDERGDTPLYEAFRCGHTKIIDWLISEFSCIPTCGSQGKTILHLACHLGYADMVETLLTQYRLESKLLSPDNDGNIPLHHASQSGSKPLVRFLITKYNCPVEFKNHSEQTPLHLACASGHVGIVELLITKYKANLNARDKHHCIPLHTAAQHGQSLVVVCLIDEYGCDPYTKGDEGKTILHYACHHGHSPLIETLLNRCAPDLLSTYDDNGNTALHLAVLGGRLDVAVMLISKYSLQINCTNKSSQTPLHLVCSTGDVSTVRSLVSVHKADFCIRDKSNNTPLHTAALNGHAEVIKCLINEFSCDPNIKGFEGRTILHHACHQGHIELVETLLSADKLYSSRVDDSGCTILHLAALGGNEKVIQLLITKYHFPVDTTNNSGETPLHLACVGGHLKVVQLLANINSANLHSFDTHNDTPLHKAAAYGQIDVITCLINEFRCNPNTKGYEGRTILHHACHQGHIALVEILLTQYRLKSLFRDYNENTALHCAALGGHEKIVKLLITKYSCPVDCQNRNKETPLHLACSKGHTTAIKTLVTEHNADLDALDENRNTPLHKAAWYGHTDVISCLIDQFSCNPNIKGGKGATILHYACHQGHTKSMVTLLSSYNLDPLSVDDNGNTPLHYAALGGKAHGAKVLITKYGCPVDCRNKSNQTPLHLACGSGHLNVVHMLVSECKADLNAHDENRDTPAHAAALFGQTRIINTMIHEFGFNPHTPGNKGRTILHHASHQGHIELVETLLTDHKLHLLSFDNNGNTALHLAAMDGRGNIAKLLINKHNYPVDCKNNVTQSPLHLACGSGHIHVVRTLLSECKADLYFRDGNNNTPIHTALLNGQVDVINCLIKEFVCDAGTKGMNGGTLLHLACQQGQLELIEHLIIDYKLDAMIGDDNGNTPLHYAALGGKSEVATLLITKYGSPVNQLNNNSETPLHLACAEGHLMFIQTLVIEHKADINTCRDMNSHTPLQRAALSGQTEVVCSLILKFGCDPTVTGLQGRNLLHYACLNDHDVLARKLIDSFRFSLISADVDGNSPLHISAMFGQNKCLHKLLHIHHAPVYLRNNLEKSALEVARDVETKKIINTYLKEERSRIQYDYKEIQKLSKKKYSGAQKLTRVFVLGNEQSGKSTLIESLKREQFFSSLNRVSKATVPLHTSGIIPSECRHKTIGRVLYYDFAGESEYCSSHSAIMSSVMQSGEGTNVCLILVNFTKNDEIIQKELGYWLSFVSYQCINQKYKCKLLTVGSHVDCITKHEARRKVALVSEFTEKYLSHASKLPIEVVKSDLAINCCKPRSLTCIHSTLNQIVSTAPTFPLSEEAVILLGLLEKDFKNVVTCKIQTLLAHIQETGIHLPKTAESLYLNITELHTIGLLMIIKSRSGKLEDCLLLLDIPKLTNKVHKVLFSKDSANRNVSSIDPHSASMGILPQTYLQSILPEYITTECLIQLQYCQEFSHAEVKFDYSVIPTKDSSAPKLLYFPALCETERKENIVAPEDYKYNISWYLKCGEMFDYLPPRFLHVLLLRLAHSFALPTAYDPSSMTEDRTAMVQLYNRCCTMWKNGIHWLMEEGVECYVEMVNNSKGIVIITKSEEAHQLICTDMLFKIIREIHQAKEEFCGTVTLQEYLIDSDDPTTFTVKDKLFSTCDIARVLQEGKAYVLSTSGQGCTQLKAAKISHLIKYVHWDADNNKGTLAPIAQVEDLPPAAAEERTCTELCEQNHSVLFEILAKHSAKWQEIATYLGFLPRELENIQAKPTLHVNAPKSWLGEMLSEWLQWTPGDQRGSTKCATLEGLSDALNKAGLSEAAQSILTLDLTT